MRTTSTDLLGRVSKALGRATLPTHVPPPPDFDEPTTRLVHSDIGLPELFERSASANKILVEVLSIDQLTESLGRYLAEKNIRRVAMPKSDFLVRTGVVAALRDAGIECGVWGQISVDDIYDYHAGLTDVYAAVAETGSVVVTAAPGNGRSLSLVPPIHIAIVEPKNILPDLVDLFPKMIADGVSSSTTIITGPSKTSDIELNLVIGVHGPIEVKVFLLK